jgi:hypothetical protein
MYLEACSSLTAAAFNLPSSPGRRNSVAISNAYYSARKRIPVSTRLSQVVGESVIRGKRGGIGAERQRQAGKSSAQAIPYPYSIRVIQESQDKIEDSPGFYMWLQ